jgi:predicted nucleic-acid-binding protein
MRAVDTNVLVRVVTRDDARQTVRADRFVEHGAWVSQLALMEMTWVLDSVYAFKADQIATAVEMLLNHIELTIQEPDVVAAAVEQMRRTPRIGFSDCLLLEVARKAGHLPLGTFDRDLGKLSGTEKL